MYRPSGHRCQQKKRYLFLIFLSFFFFFFFPLAPFSGFTILYPPVFHSTALLWALYTPTPGRSSQSIEYCDRVQSFYIFFAIGADCFTWSPVGFNYLSGCPHSPALSLVSFPFVRNEDGHVVYVDVRRHLRLPVRLFGAVHPGRGNPVESLSPTQPIGRTSASRSISSAADLVTSVCRLCTDAVAAASSTIGRLFRLFESGRIGIVGSSANGRVVFDVGGRCWRRTASAGKSFQAIRFQLSQLRRHDGLVESFQHQPSRSNGPLFHRQIRSRWVNSRDCFSLHFSCSFLFPGRIVTTNLSHKMSQASHSLPPSSFNIQRKKEFLRVSYEADRKNVWRHMVRGTPGADTPTIWWRTEMNGIQQVVTAVWYAEYARRVVVIINAR